MKECGFTLLELLITVAIMTLLLAIGLPNLSQQIQNNRTKAAALDLFSAVQLTRNTAVSTNTRATLRHLGSWQRGWEVFIDSNDNGQRDAAETVLSATTSPLSHITVTGGSSIQTYISFTGTGESRKASGHPGGAFLAGTLVICSVEGGDGYALILSRGGRMRMAPAADGDC